MRGKSPITKAHATQSRTASTRHSAKPDADRHHSRSHARPPLVRRFFDKVVNMGNPLCGAQLLAMQESQLLFRSDGRGAARLVVDGGLRARVPTEDILHIRQSRVQEYQDSNLSPFGFGACNNLNHILEFEKANYSLTESQTLHAMFAKAVSLARFKIEAGMELSPRDHENEQIVLETVAINNFLASIPPEYKEKFWAGAMVPNQLCEFAPTLKVPKHVRAEDLSSERFILRWLLRNNCEEMFAKICDEMFRNIKEESLLKRLSNDKHLVADVRTMIASFDTEKLGATF
jgi:hypothetical protein